MSSLFSVHTKKDGYRFWYADNKEIVEKWAEMEKIILKESEIYIFPSIEKIMKPQTLTKEMFEKEKNRMKSEFIQKIEDKKEKEKREYMEEMENILKELDDKIKDIKSKFEKI